MAFTPWLTSEKLIEAVKRKISFPVDQNTFSEEDILAFANEEMQISQIPNVMEFHEEYFVTSVGITLEANKSRYPIPNRAIGMKLRDVMYGDGNATLQTPYGNLFEMTMLNPGDKAYFQNTNSSYPGLLKYYLEGNNIVLVPSLSTNATGLLVCYFFLRPNQLVEQDRAAIISGFSKTITVSNASLAPGDTLTIDSQSFTAVASGAGANQFEIGATNTQTATNLVSCLNTNGIVTANNGSPATNVVKVVYETRTFDIEASNTVALVVQSTIGLESTSSIPENITDGSLVDLLQTLPGHKTYKYDVEVPEGGVSGSTLSLNETDVPEDFIVGDYVCSENECIIPQIPPELHTGLAERVCGRILSAIGDREGLQDVNAKIEQINSKEGVLIDNRVDASPKKLFNKRSFMRMNKSNQRVF